MSSDAYFAGIVDGEGCISFYNRKGGRSSNKTHTINVTVCMTWLPILEALKSRFGGSICKRKKSHPQLKQQYAWTACSNAAYNCLVAVQPWLIEKQEQARIAIEAREWQLANNNRGRGHGSSNIEAYYQKSAEYNITLKSLKNKEFP